MEPPRESTLERRSQMQTGQCTGQPESRRPTPPKLQVVPAGSSDDAGRLADFDQVAVGVPDVSADLASVVLRLGKELGALRRPFLVGLLDVSDTNVEECACAVGVGRGRESDAGLVVRRTAAHIENQPRVRYLHDHRVAVQENLPVEQRPIELTGPVLIGNHKKMRDDEAVLRRRKVLWIHLTTSTLHW